MGEDISISAALLAGLVSFLSPCVLPLVPSYFTFITGTSLDKLTDAPTAAVRGKIILSTLAFVSGFSVVFILLGASASFLSNLLFAYKAYLRIAGGILILLFGIHLLGVWRIRLLEFDKRIHLRDKPLHFLGTFVVGMAFGAGWSPCIGPMLGSILILASNQQTVLQGIWLLTLYSAGLALPFVILSIGINFMVVFIRRTTKVLRYINVAAGILLIGTGILLIADKLHLPSAFF